MLNRINLHLFVSALDLQLSSKFGSTRIFAVQTERFRSKRGKEPTSTALWRPAVHFYNGIDFYSGFLLLSQMIAEQRLLEIRTLNLTNFTQCIIFHAEILDHLF